MMVSATRGRQVLLEAVNSLRPEPFEIYRMVDQRRHYRLDLDPRFPLSVKLYTFSDLTSMLRFNWHERLEIFVGVAGKGLFRMGERVLEFSRGDVIVVDNLKLHGVVDWPGTRRWGLVITFLPELVCNPGSYPCDSAYLLPFFSRTPEINPVLRAGERLSAPVHDALGKLVECYSDEAGASQCFQAGCKAHLLEALYCLARHFGLESASFSEYGARRQQSLQFGRVYEYLWENYSEPITVAQAASMVGMSEFRFMKFFKKATGMTFVTYLTHLRLTCARRLLEQTDRSIADIAATVGFADQSYFDRRFRQHYGETPRRVRERAGFSE
jgi:AraC family transcriptional activator of pobA